MPRTEATFQIGGHDLRLSNLDKVLYPDTGFTKGQVIDYLAKIAPVLLPHLHDRPLTMKRYPNGVNAEFFYEKRAPKYRPSWIKTCSSTTSPASPGWQISPTWNFIRSSRKNRTSRAPRRSCSTSIPDRPRT
jgi:bifunctional non-homologous end joining protein LigD